MTRTPRPDGDPPARRRQRRRPTGRVDPGSIDPIPFPIDPPGPGPLSIAGLDTTLPLTMFPVRLATRLHRPEPDQPPTELWIRIFPDLIHADGHLPELTKEEITLALAYWERLWRAADDQQRRDDTHRWAVSQLGAGRTAWVVGQTTPVNPDDAPRLPVPDDQQLPRPPQLPKLVARTASRPTLARMLPDVWHVTVRHSVEFVTRAWSNPVRRDLAMAPNLADIPADGGVGDLLHNQDVWWMVDFDAAVEAGMALRMRWDPPVGGPRFATEVVVFGVRGDNTGADTELADLLDAHRFTSALEIVAPGTPTNNTDTVTAGFTATPADLESYLDRQAPPMPDSRPRRTPLPPPFPPPPFLPTPLGRASAGEAASRALGLPEVNAFDHAEHAGLLTGAWASDMNRAMWPATIDYLLSQSLATGGLPAVADSDREWLGGWCRDWVRAGGFLPTIRVDTQPYGLFPIDLRPDSNALVSTDLDRLRGVLYDLWDDWFFSLGLVANFSNATGGLFGSPPPTPEEEAVRLAAVLGAVPNPTAFRLRPATVRYDEIATEWDDAIAEMEDLLLQSHSNLHTVVYTQTWKDEINDGDLSDQSTGLSWLRNFADQMIGDESQYSEGEEDAAGVARDYIDTVLRAMTAAHDIRSETSQWEEKFSAAHLPTPDDPPLWYVEYGDDGAAPDGTFPTLRLVPDRAASAVARTLRDFAADARRTGSIPRPGYLPGTAGSLLDKLVEFGVMNVDADHAEQMALGLDGLAGMLETSAVADPLGELTRLLRESLGLATHRLDAWFSSLANQRLAALRAKRPTGLQVAGYGWVVNLEPDNDGGADSHGFIHAPSLDHAATAAVLRSAWLNYASDAQDAPFGVDVSSERVRRAQWLLEGVRNGVDLAELLGARFERRLHDGGHSDLIADVRRLVLDATGHVGEPAQSIVDGLAIAVGYSDSTATDPVHDAIEQWRATLPGYPNDGVGGPLHATVGDLDSTADLLTTQAVHSVIKGNLSEAAATLSVAGAGDAGIPQLRVPDVHRESQLITHRLVAILPPPATDAAATSLLAIAEPTLAHWLSTLLPAPAEIGVTVEFGDAGPGTVWRGTLAQLGFDAIHIVALAAVDGRLATSALGQLVTARARFELGVDAGAPARLSGAAADVSIAAGAARAMLGTARLLRGDDLAATTGLGHVVDVAELDRRRLALAAALADLGATPSDGDVITSRFADLAVLDPGGLLAVLAAPDGSDQLIADLLAKATKCAERLGGPLPDDWTTLTAATQADRLIEQIGDALGVSIPVLPFTELANRAELAVNFAGSSQRLGSPMQAMTWLLEVGRVHRGAGMCAEMLDLVEVLNPAALIAFQVAQLPNIDGEPWVAARNPTAPGARLDLVCITDAATATAVGPIAGLVLEAWTEPIPGGQATTGVALHFDRPGAQPPQAVLLAMPPDDGDWTTRHIESLLIETLELVMVRAIGPETLTRLGHTLPAVTIASGAVVDTVPDGVGPIDVGPIEVPDLDDHGPGGLGVGGVGVGGLGGVRT
jgi:hypothetical protein